MYIDLHHSTGPSRIPLRRLALHARLSTHSPTHSLAYSMSKHQCRRRRHLRHLIDRPDHSIHHLQYLPTKQSTQPICRCIQIVTHLVTQQTGRHQRPLSGPKLSVGKEKRLKFIYLYALQVTIVTNERFLYVWFLCESVRIST